MVIVAVYILLFVLTIGWIIDKRVSTIKFKDIYKRLNDIEEEVYPDD